VLVLRCGLVVTLLVSLLRWSPVEVSCGRIAGLLPILPLSSTTAMLIIIVLLFPIVVISALLLTKLVLFWRSILLVLVVGEATTHGLLVVDDG